MLIMEKDALKTRFLKVYSNLSINLRKEVILVIKEHGPITWDVAYTEVENNTELSEKILKDLSNLEII